MLKGKSTVQLFDAATGAKLLEQSDTNMVTNALEIIANSKEKSGILKWWKEVFTNIHEHSSITPLFSMVPLYKRMLSGVLLWDGNITEDPNIVIPPAGVSEVGHAGDSYSGTDIYRGSLNVNESGEIPGGWRYVWDFDTDKANGTVKCISLTSWHGGNIGYHGCFSGDMYPRYTVCYFHNANSYHEARSNAYGIAVEESGVSGTAFHLRTMEDGSVRLYKRNNTEVWYLKLAGVSKIGLFTDRVTYTEKVVLPFTPTNSYASIYVYKGQIHEIALLSTNRLQHRIFTLEGEPVSNKTIDLSFSFDSVNTNKPAVYRNGYYYCIPCTDVDMVKADEQGREIDRIPILTSRYDMVGSLTINDFNDDITFGIRGNGYNSYTYYNTYTLDTKDNVLIASDINNYPCAYHGATASTPYPQYLSTNDPNSPFIFYYDPANSKILPLVNTCYLATINNLQAPITKTAAQTMKITYEIYDE